MVVVMEVERAVVESVVVVVEMEGMVGMSRL